MTTHEHIDGASDRIAKAGGFPKAMLVWYRKTFERHGLEWPTFEEDSCTSVEYRLVADDIWTPRGYSNGDITATLTCWMADGTVAVRRAWKRHRGKWSRWVLIGLWNSRQLPHLQPEAA